MTAAAMVPGMPTGVSAMTTSDTEITVSWMAPAADGGADITGYVLQRKSGDGEFMTIAATDAATWWNALDCPMMNDAVPADATPVPGSDDPDADPRSPYCYMYDGLSEEAKTVVNDAFAANYGTITGTEYMDMGLTAETMYYYRVSATNSAGAGEWSDGMAYAMTDRTNTAPVAGDAIADQTVTAGESVDVEIVAANFTDPEGDTLTYSASSGNEAAATVSVDGSTVTITGHMAGMATITVTATDSGNMAGERKLSVDQTFDVTVESASTELGAPTGVTTCVGGSGDPGCTDLVAGQVKVTWGAADNADRYIAVLFDSNFEFNADHVATHQTEGSVTFSNVPAGTYTAAVISIKDDANGNAEDIDFGIASATVAAAN